MPPQVQELHVTASKPSRLLRAVVSAVLAGAVLDAHALPAGAEIKAGEGAIAQSGSVLTVEQTTPKLAIDWSSFGIKAGESVVFNQPTAQSIALNRVLGQDPSVILGNLSSNGQVFLLNPNGVLFGQGSQVSAAALLASTLDISVADFTAGRYTFTKADRAEAVVNQGTLRARDGGFVAMLAPRVVNDGVISAHLGTAALGAGDQITLTLDGARLVGFNVDRAAADALVSNQQLIEADGGAAILSARARDALLATVINNEGVIEARSVSVKDGVIRLDGGTSGVVSNSGVLDVSGANVAERAGRIEVLGQNVGLFSGSQLDASGDAGGGTILIGGDKQGLNPAVHNAEAVYVAPTATVNADGRSNGNGGKVIVWSDDVTRYSGHISARGGSGGGDGGFIETSGKAWLEALGTADASAPLGRAGEWLLDPYDVTLSTAATSNGSQAGGIFTPSGDSAIANITAIQTSLNGGTSVTINTAGGGAQAGNITVANAISKTGGASATLTLNATNQISFAAGANLTSTSNQLNVTLNAGAGGISSLRNVNTNGGALTFNSAGAATQAAGSVISGTGTVVKQGSGQLTLSGANTYTGATTVSAGTLAAASATALGTVAGGVVVANGATLQINGFAIGAEPVTLNGSGVGGVGALTAVGTASLSGAVTLSSPSSLGAANVTDTLTLSGVIGGANALTKLGAGTLVLSGNNTYTGATNISAGTLQLGAANRIANTSAVSVSAGATFNLNNFAETIGSLAGAGNVALGSAILTLGDSTSTVFSGVLSGSGALTKTGSGTLTLAGANTYTGATTISAGTLRLAGGSAIADTSAITLANVAGASLDLNDTNETIGSLAGGGATGGTVTFGSGTLTTGGNNTTTTYSGVLSGTGGVTKIGTGVFTLAAANTYSGATTVNAGTLSATNASSLGTVAGGALVNTGGTLSISADISGKALTLNGGTLAKDNAVTTRTWSGALTLAAPSTFSTPNGTLTVSGAIDGAGDLTKSGTGTLIVSGGNTYSGATNVTAGTLRVAGGNGIGDGSAVTLTTGTTLDLNGTTESIGSVAGAGNITLGAGALNSGGNGASTTYSGVVSGTGSFAKAGTGTLTLSGANTYTGATSISGGTLRLGAAARIADTSAVTVGAGALFDLNSFAETVGSVAGGGDVTLGSATLTAGGNNSSTTFSGTLSGTGGFTKAGTGATTFSGANAYTGLTTINAGTLRLAGGAAIADASAVTLANVAGASLDLNGIDETIGSLAGGGTTGGNVTLGSATLFAGANNTSTTYSGVVSGSGGLTMTGTGTLTLSGANTYSGATLVTAGTLRLGAANRIADASALTVASGATFNLNNFAETVGSLSGGGSLTLGTATLASGANNSSTAFTGVISGTGGVAKQGTGRLTLSGTNTYTGVTTISAGTVVAANASALGTAAAGVTVSNGATLEINGVAIGAEALTLNGSGVGGAGALTGVGAASLAGNVTLATGSSVAVAGAADNLTLSGVISGANALTKLGGGTLTLSGNNTYTGATNISAGTLRLGAANRIANSSALVVASGATFDLNDFAETIGSLAGAGNVTLGNATLAAGGDNTSTSFSGVLSGTGAVTKAGSGAMTLAGVNTYTGATTISAGTLRLAGGSAIADTSAITLANVAGASLDLNGTDETIGSLAGGGTTGGNVTLGAGVLTTGANSTSTTYSGVLSGTGGLTKIGTGTLTLAGADTYSGATTITAGTLQLGAANRIADASAVTVASGATFNLNSFAETIGSLSGAGNVVLGTAMLASGANNSSTDFAGVISGTGAVTKQGTGRLRLSGANTYTGATTISAGTLVAANAAALGTTAGGAVVANGATLEVDAAAIGTEAITLNGSGVGGAGALTGTGSASHAGNVTLATPGSIGVAGSADTLTLSGVISGANALTKVGAGTLVLSGSNTYTGATNINAGTLRLGAASRIADGSAVTVAAGALFDLNNFAETIGSLAGAGDVSLGSATLTAGGNNTSTSFSGALSGSGGLTKVGSGTTTLAGANLYSGATTINAGTLRVSADNALSATSAVTLANIAGATLDLNGTIQTIGSLAGGGVSGGNVILGSGTLTTGGNDTSTTYSGVLSGTGGIEKIGTGIFTLAGVSTYSGSTAVRDGTLSATNSSALGAAAGGALIDTNGTLLISADIAGKALTLNGGTLAKENAATTRVWSGAITLNAPSTFSTPSGTLSVSGAIGGTGGVTKIGTGTLSLSGNNTYSGATNVTAGTLRAAGGNAIGDVSALALSTGTTLDLNGTTETVGSLAGSGSVQLGAGSLTSGGNGASTVYSGTVAGGGGLTKVGAGTLELSGVSTYGGATLIDGGTLVVSNGSALGAVGGATTVADGATLQIAGVALDPEPFTLNGSGAGGAGALAGTGNSSISGAVTLASGAHVSVSAGGSLTFLNSVNGPGALDIGGAGTLALNGDVGSTSALDSLTADAATVLLIGGGLVRTTGTQTYNGATTINGATTLRTTGGNILATGPLIATSGVLSLDSGPGDVTLNNPLNDFGEVIVASANAVSLVDANSLTLGASTLGTLRARSLSGDLTLNGAITASAMGDAIVLASAGNFINSGGSLNAPAGRWLVYSADPSFNSLGGMSSDFKRYNCTFSAGCLTPGTQLPLTGNGLLYGVAPVLSVDASGASVEYGAPGVALSYSVSGFIDGDATASALTGALARASGATSGSGNEVVGAYAVNSGTLASDLGYQLSFTGADYVVTPRALVVTANGETKIYDGNSNASVAMTDNRILGDALAETYSGAAFSDRNAGVGKTITVSDIALTGADAGNYVLASRTATTTADIGARPITLVADAQTKRYGSPDPALTYSVSSGGLLGTDTLSGSPTRIAGETVAGGPYSITQGSLFNPNYAITFADGELRITPATLSYMATPVSIFQGAPLPTFTGTVSGFVGADTLASATSGLAAFAAAVSNSNTAGVFEVAGGGLTANSGNYVFTQAPGNATALVVSSAETPATGVPSKAYSGSVTSAIQTNEACAPVIATSAPPAACSPGARSLEEVSLSVAH